MAQTQSEYDSDRELARLYASITGRAPFSYTPSRDPLYRSYADRYVQDGRMAMRDTVGQSAALTGGYSSSYAQTAGQQQYGEYLRRLGEVLPELYGRALERYRLEGESLRADYGLARQREEDAYQRSRDALDDERYAAEQAAAEAAEQLKQRDAAYQRLYKLVSGAGYVPTDEELDESGLTRAQAEALRSEYLRTHKQPAASGGSDRSSSKSSSKTTGAKETKSAAALTLPSILNTIVKPAVKKTGGATR